MSDEMTTEEYREAARRTSEWVAEYRERLEDLPVLPRGEFPVEVFG